MKPKLIRLPVLRLAGFIYNTTTRFGENFAAFPKFWHTYMNDGRMERLQNEDFVKSHVHYGVCFSEDPRTGNFQYLIGMAVKEGAVIPAEYEVRELPAAAYAVFSIVPAEGDDLTAAIYNTWAYIYGSWLPKSGLHIDGRSCDFEYYDDQSSAPAGQVCDVYIPVICAPNMTAFPKTFEKPVVTERVVTADCSAGEDCAAALEFV
jgi:AraC family transcriptional regulator